MNRNKHKLQIIHALSQAKGAFEVLALLKGTTIEENQVEFFKEIGKNIQECLDILYSKKLDDK